MMQESHLPSVISLEIASHSHPWSKKNFLDSINSSHQCWVAFVEEKLVGYAIMSSGGGEAELLNISVDHRSRRQGIARQLLEFMIEQLPAGVDTIFLEVRRSNRPAITFYDSFGFNEVGERPNYYPVSTSSGGVSREDALIFAKPLFN